MSADVDQAASQLADILEEVGADVLTCYDWHGGYGHPDHIQVHRVGHRAAQILQGRGRSVRLLESTMNRSRLAEMIRASGEAEFDPDAPADDGNPFGTLEEDITMAVDVSRYIDAKRASIASHASQVTDSSIFLQMPSELFAVAFGTEWFIEPGKPGGAAPGWFM
jgi:LmbE family N-acetylglucosaminyl deacetylase